MMQGYLSNNAASRLRHSTGKILEKWAKQVCQEIPIASTLNLEELYNELPIFFEKLSQIISTTQATPTGERFASETVEVSRAHGASRAASTGYTLDQVIWEYRILRKVTLDILEAGGPVTRLERDKLLEAVDHALLESAAEFSELAGFQKSRFMTELEERARKTRLLLSRSQQETREMIADRDKYRTDYDRLIIAEAHFRKLTDALPYMIWTVTPEGLTNYYNQRWFDYTGLTLDETWIKAVISIIHPEDYIRCEADWILGIKSGTAFEQEYRLKRKDGEYRWFLARTLPVRDNQGNICQWVGGATDIENQKQAFEKLQLEQRLRDKFVATLSHDLRNPLTAARVSAQLIHKKLGQADIVSKLSTMIIFDIDRIDRMIQDLLDASRIHVGQDLPLKKVRSDLMPVIKQTLEELAVVYGDRFILENGKAIVGDWDGDKIRRVIENLCTNAVKYGYSQSPIRIIIEQSEKEVKIHVHNRGPVIASSEQGWLFQPFHRTISARESQKRGWGLGLNLAKSIVEAHEGVISVTSSEEEGTIFTITLPKEVAYTRAAS